VRRGSPQSVVREGMMATRTESKSIQVDPSQEQTWIDVLQKFGWSLMNSQEVLVYKNEVYTTEWGDASGRPAGEVATKTTKTNYVKLQFSRPLDLPNLPKIREIEGSYFALKQPRKPKIFPIHWLLWLIAAFIYGLGIAASLAYLFLGYRPKKARFEREMSEYRNKRTQMLAEAADLL
jgi:hypothetical protein